MSVQDRDLGWSRIKNQLKELKGAHTKIGIQQGSKREDASPMVVIAAAHEFGTPSGRPPERSFLRRTHEVEKARLGRMMDAEWSSIMAGRSTPKRSLALIGEYFEARVKARIRTGIPPALAPATLARRRNKVKASAVALNDTGQLVQSIRHVEVIRGKAT